MQQSPFFHRIHEFCEPTSAFDEATRQIEAEHLGTTWEIWSFLVYGGIEEVAYPAD